MVVVDFIAYYLYGLAWLIPFLASLIAVSGLDDVVIDTVFLGRAVYRKFFVYTRHRAMFGENLAGASESWIAIMVPAWQEAAVIEKMLRHVVSTAQYTHYHIFVGTYPNDPDTRRAVLALGNEWIRAPGSPQRPDGQRISIVDVGHPGPTSKADCLNAIYREIQAFEQTTGIDFAIYVLHDAEDVVHPRSLRLYNHLIPRKDMVQLPVVPLERPMWNLVGCHYMDEFAESHIKDLTVREALTGAVAGAGVGCAFSAGALKLANGEDGPFDVSSLTEDYDLSQRLHLSGCKTVFVRMPVVFGERGWGGLGRDFIATREYFPDRTRAAIRQKARWLMGIAFQSWGRQGWRGSLAQKYMFFRDRKAVWTAQINMAAYFVAANVGLILLINALFPESYRFPPLIPESGPVHGLLLVNLGLVVNRIIHRFAYVSWIYGPLHGLLSVPRLVIGNFINFAAAIRATRLFLIHKLTGRPLAWDKTAHSFPAEDALKRFARRPETVNAPRPVGLDD